MILTLKSYITCKLVHQTADKAVDMSHSPANTDSTEKKKEKQKVKETKGSSPAVSAGLSVTSPPLSRVLTRGSVSVPHVKS